MKKIYFTLCRLIGYRLMLLDYWDPQTFTLHKRNTHLVLYKYLGRFKHDGSVRLKQVFRIQIRKI